MTGKHDAQRELKRRRLLAGVGALVAGIAATRGAQPVRAATDSTFVATGGDSYAFRTAQAATYAYGVSVSASTIGVDARGPIGVYAESGNGYGVHGASPGGYGVVGDGGSVGVVGRVNGANNTIGVYGNNLSTGADGVGVYGSCANGTGVYGQTAASNQYGVLGTTYAPNSTAIAGTCTGDGSSAFSGGTANPNAFAGVFQGNVVIQGNIAISGNKSAVIQHPRTGDHRLVYCVESPEAWFEDFGEGTLTAGKATVTLDADFAVLIHTDRYHVFLTEYGGNNALYVDKRGATGFEVHAEKPGASGTFSWRVVGKRADVKAERLSTFVMPNLPLPDPAKFKAPNFPPPAVPPQKP